MAFRMQEFIHKWELGSGRHYLRTAAALIGMLSLLTVYDLVAFRNFATQEAMDSAQLARNISEGRGYVTHFIRPFSMYLLKRQHLAAQAQSGGAGASTNSAAGAAGLDMCRLRQPHPDLANPPVYPLLLAGLLKVMPFGYPDLSQSQTFSIFKPDLWITLFNQVLFLAAVWMVFRLGRTVFDESVAWVGAGAFLSSDLFWRFSVSGLSTMLLVVIFLGLVWILALLEPAAREETRGQTWLMSMAAVAGALAGIGCLTRYAFGWLILPVLVLLFLSPARNRMGLVMAAVFSFLLLVSPWAARNFQWSGTPFGVSGFALYQNTPQFPENELERSLNPDLSQTGSSEVLSKLCGNAREIFQNDLPRIGGSWVSAFFLAGLLVPFRNVRLSRLRLFLVLALAVFGVAQAVGRTSLSTESPELNSENLLVVLAPLVFIFGAGFFLILLEQLSFPLLGIRHLVVGIFCLLAAAPLLLTFLSPHPSPIAYPPYYPPWIQHKARLMGDHELIMTDLPWAVAWYGGPKKSVWLTLRYKDKPGAARRNDFYEVNDFLKPVNALYLSTKMLKTLDPRALWKLEGEETEWEWSHFIFGVFSKREVPTGFPLKRAPDGLLPEIFLTDSERIKTK